MILPNNTSVLRNIKDSFYYNGIEISKENFDIEEFAKICDRVNDIKSQIKQEKPLNSIRQNHIVIGRIYLAECNIWLLCKVDKEKIYLGLYDDTTKNIIPLTTDILKKITDDNIFLLSYNLNKTANLIQRKEIEKTIIRDRFENYIRLIEKSGNSFQNTYELEFVSGYKEYILTDEELKKSIIER